MTGTSRDTYVKLPDTNKLDVLFDEIQDIKCVSDERDDALDVRVTRIEGQKWLRIGASGLGGAIAAILVFLGFKPGG